MKNKKIICEPALYRILKPPAVFLFSLIFHPRIVGAENIPKNGPIVLAGNHIKFWDCFMVMAGTKRCVHFLAKAELFGNFFTKWFFSTAGLIPVHRTRKDHNALESAENYLKSGCVIGVFPEGTTKKADNQLLPFKIGAIKMAKDTNTDIVPFTIRGKYRPFAASAEIIFQKPFSVESDDLNSENEKLKQMVKSNLEL